MTESHIESKLREYSMTKVDAEMTEFTDFDEKQSDKINDERTFRLYLFRMRWKLYKEFILKCMRFDDALYSKF